MKKHEWREKTEDGETRLVTATRHGGKWQLQSRLKSEDEWTKFEKIDLDDLEALLDIIEDGPEPLKRVCARPSSPTGWMPYLASIREGIRRCRDGQLLMCLCPNHQRFLSVLDSGNAIRFSDLGPCRRWILRFRFHFSGVVLIALASGHFSRPV